jgi:CBS domain containing-hemolysin-like protein
MVELIIISLLTLSITAFCAVLAASLSAVSINRLNEIAENQSSAPAERKAAQRLLELKRDIHAPKMAIFIADLLTYTIGCVSIGGYAMWKLSSVQVGLVAVTTTFVMLIVGHLFPRALGERYAPSLIRVTANGVSALMVATKPLVQIVQRFYEMVAPTDTEETTREELSEILETAREEGSLDAGEYRILSNIMRFGSIQVSDVMTPRTVVFSCPAAMAVADVLMLPEFRQYSRFPIFEDDDLDSVVGYVLAKDVLWSALQAHATGEHPVRMLRDLMREVSFVPENIGLDRALEHFLERREHLFIVVDEYGGVEGLLTMEDVMETILGVEILDEADAVMDLRQFAKQRRDQRIASLQEQNAQFDSTTTADSVQDMPELPLQPTQTDAMELERALTVYATGHIDTES